MRVTAEMLQAENACPDQVGIFAAEWPDGVEVTESTLARAHDLGLDVEWWVAHCLPAPIQAEYDKQMAPISAEYDKQVDTIRAEYRKQVAPIQAEYDKQMAPISAEYRKQVAPIWAEYDKQMAPIWAEYRKQVDAILLSVLTEAGL